MKFPHINYKQKLDCNNIYYIGKRNQKTYAFSFSWDAITTPQILTERNERKIGFRKSVVGIYISEEI